MIGVIMHWDVCWGPPFSGKLQYGASTGKGHEYKPQHTIWVVVKNMVPFWIPIIIRHLIFRVPKKGP